MPSNISFKGMIEVFKNSFKGFQEDKVPKLSAALAYFTVFSMGPLLVVIISLCGLFLGKEAIEGKVYDEIDGFVGPDTAAQVQYIIKSASLEGKSKIAAIIGGITLLIGATSIFAEIQDSINGIWGLRPKPKRGWVKFLQNRVLSFSVIIGLGFLLLVSLFVSGLIDAFTKYLQTRFPDAALIIFYIGNQIITFGVIVLIFGAIFKVLPDANIMWKDVLAGAIATALLFMLGKFAISFYISKSNVGTTYGGAGSLVVLLVWVYYSSFILYFGAEFTKAYAVKYGSKIYPNHYAVTTKTVVVETGSHSVQDKENLDVETTLIKKDKPG